MNPEKRLLSLRLVIALAGLLVVLPACTRADAPVAPPTLAQALTFAEPPKEGVCLAVAADTVKLPDKLPEGVVPARSGDSAVQVAEGYGRGAQEFGNVTAIAPLTMTVVYSPPETPNPYDGMPPGQILKLLSKTFTLEQWKAFLGPSGVGYMDMQEGTQKKLFESLFPEGHLLVIEDNPIGPNDLATKQDISGKPLTQARLHLGYMVSIALQYVGKPDEHVFAGTGETANAPKRYFMTNAQSNDVDHEFGALVHETLTNAPKPGQLPFDAAALTVPVPLVGIKTVDDLVAQIGKATRIEMYADPRYGARKVTVIGSAKSAPAHDLLQALAYCVTGTYRQVGPAFVLTDDVTGLGTRHALWKSFEEKAQAMLPGNGDVFAETSPNPNMPYTVQDISWGGDPLAFTPAQREAYWRKWRGNPEQSSNPMMDLTLPFDQLTPAQQVVAQQAQQDNEKQHLDTTLDGTVMIQAEPMLELTLPALDGPVIVFQSYQGLLPYPSLTPAEEKANAKRMEAEFPPPAGENVPVPIGPLRLVVRGLARRAVRIAPRTPREVTRALTALNTLGFNEAWIQITPAPKAAGDTTALSLLAQAVGEAKAAGITVFPDLRLLRWGDGAPASLLDLDIAGKSGSKAFQEAGPDRYDTVTPFAPDVSQRLRTLVQRISNMPGIGGMVWEEMTPTGYEGLKGNDQSPETEMGYAEAGRLACLRAAHTDPIDLYTNSFTDERAHVSVPGFGDFNQDRALCDKWRALRGQMAFTLARHLTSALPPLFNGPTRLPLIVPPSGSPYSSVYGSWDDFRQPPPGEEFISPRGPDGEVIMGSRSIERMPAALVYQRLDVFGMPNASAQAWAAAAGRALRDARQHGQGNILLDVTRQPEILDALADNERAGSPVRSGGSGK